MSTNRRKRYLIVNADDFGLSHGINRGVIQAHERGIVTSASLMVRGRVAAEAAAYCHKHPELSVGLHFDLGEWACRSDTWVQLYQVVPEDDFAAVAVEAARQLAAFRRLVGRNPTHIDSHQHAHLEGPARVILGRMARQLRVPLRRRSSCVRYCGDFYGQGSNGKPYPNLITVPALIRILKALPPGFTELGCHPGLRNAGNSMYRSERGRELETLCDPRVREAITEIGIELRSFHDVDAPGAKRSLNRRRTQSSKRLRDLTKKSPA
jgi:chitin disaccharide deacetylase